MFAHVSSKMMLYTKLPQTLGYSIDKEYSWYFCHQAMTPQLRIVKVKSAEFLTRHFPWGVREFHISCWMIFPRLKVTILS